jgi:hypothetical protein
LVTSATNSHADPNSNPYAYSNGSPNTHTDTICNSYAHPYGNTNTYAYTYSNTRLRKSNDLRLRNYRGLSCRNRFFVVSIDKKTEENIKTRSRAE